MTRRGDDTTRRRRDDDDDDGDDAFALKLHFKDLHNRLPSFPHEIPHGRFVHQQKPLKPW